MKMKKFLSCLLASAVAVTGMIGAGYAPVVNDSRVLAATAVYSPADSEVLWESAYMKWAPVSGAEGYNVYYGSGGNWTQIDSMLIRQYNDGMMRADAVGLKAGKYTMKAVPIKNGREDTSNELVSSEMTIKAHDRSGYAFEGGAVPGAYKADGTLKDNAVVVYVTNENKDKVTASLNAEGKGNVDCVGVQNIITAYKKGKETRPIAIRFIGNIEDPANMPKGDLYVDSSTAGMTLEGIGSDATFNGFGLVIKGSSLVEVRNLGFMNCDSSEGDDVGLQQDDDHCWVHNCDMFYGEKGSDADQVKGDGALDTKKSHYITHSYNHFWDNGKCNLQGANASDTSNHITYHHNWYDHSDSRHPRVRVATVHVYNNYYDGNAKYGIGSTTDSDVFAENNYFRNCKYPMMISMQGTDIKAGKTFSGENGGMIKAYGNVMTGQKSFISYADDNTEFDAYVASSRDEKVPSDVKAKQGGATYNNFDTASDMYKYTPDKAENVPAVVMAGAGRVGGGDFKWTFTAADDESSDLNEGLKAALEAYTDSIKSIGSGFSSDVTVELTTEPTTEPTTKPTDNTETTKKTVETTEATTKQDTTETTTSKDPDKTDAQTIKMVLTGKVIYCSPDAQSSGKGTLDDPMDVETAISKIEAGGIIYLLEGTYKYSSVLKIPFGNDGEDGKYKAVMPYENAKVTLDFSDEEYKITSGKADNSNQRGIQLDGSYWFFKGITVTGAADNGMYVTGSNNIIELCRFEANRDTGLQIARRSSSLSDMKDWPSNNLILNCTSCNNNDPATGEDADGFASKLTCGPGNVFDGCIAYNNVDDGWDLFAKSETGPIGVVTIRNCVSFRNGATAEGVFTKNSDGNGFKLGGSGVGSAHVIENSLSFENKKHGFTDNNNPEFGSAANLTSYKNGMESGANYQFDRCTAGTFKNLLSYKNNSGTSDKLNGTATDCIIYNSKKYWSIAGTLAVANAKAGDEISGPMDDDFISVESPALGADVHVLWRDEDGSVNTHGFMVLKDTSSFVGKGFSLETVNSPKVVIVTEGGEIETTETTTSSDTNTDTTTTTTAETTGNGSSDTTSDITTDATTTTEKPTAPTGEVDQSKIKYGDVTCNGAIEINDVVRLNVYILTGEGLDATAFKNADCNCDGVAGLDDSGMIVDCIANIIKESALGPQTK